MRNKIFCLGLSALMGLSSLGAQTIVSPLVQSSTMSSVNTITRPTAVHLSVLPSRQNSYPINNLRQWLTISTDKKAFPLAIGVRGDKTIKSVEKHIPKHSEGYYLSIAKDGIVVAGHDERGLFYGLQTLRQKLQDSNVTIGTITDYPDVPYRGVVEGFYGTPWSYEDRLSQLAFYGRNKLNVYIYGPKDDPYHSVPNWRKPYPVQEADQIRSLVKTAKDNGVIFYWAIHPGQDIKWNEEDRV